MQWIFLWDQTVHIIIFNCIWLIHLPSFNVFMFWWEHKDPQIKTQYTDSIDL